MDRAFITSCPTIFGSTSWPLILISALDFICLLLTVNEVFESFAKSKNRKRYSRQLFCILLSIFLFIRLLFYFVPFRWNQFTCVFMSEQLPHFFLVAAWLSLALWLSSAIFPMPEKHKTRSYIINALFGVLLIILFIVTLVLTIITWKHPPTNPNRPYTLYANLVLYSVVVISISVYGVQLTRIAFCSPHLSVFAKRIRLLVVLIGIIFVVFLTRFLYSLLRLIGVNPIASLMGNQLTKCVTIGDREKEGKSQCRAFMWGYVICQTIWEAIPTVALLITFQVLKTHKPTGKKKKKGKKRRRTAHKESKSQSSNSNLYRNSPINVDPMFDSEGVPEEEKPLLSF
ncbi:hypothetical protein BLNAU_7268 [Blattamonas nauphoetae]|uniref:Uncharacterized protein n=1 Tax=Blattamonas nauphoetae TaxID=2049346 RepID=A0ABQ9Y2F0_9EUKA|nr:hypothetical protein BLNAU_7268 [Blattamonas nauphoetae]